MSAPVGAAAEAAPILKPLDAWWTVLFIDPVCRPALALVRRLSWVTPTGLTVAAHLLGVVSAALFFVGAHAAGAVVFEVRFVLDCLDGKLARATGRSSAAGGHLDFVGDFIVVGANIGCLTLAMLRDHGLPAWVAVTLPAVFVGHITANQAWGAEVRRRQGDEGARTANKLPGGYRSWMAARRLRALPSRIDFEHGLLFVAPVAAALADRPGLLLAAVWIAAAYFTYETLHQAAMGYRLAAERDRAAAGGS